MEEDGVKRTDQGCMYTSNNQCCLEAESSENTRSDWKKLKSNLN